MSTTVDKQTVKNDFTKLKMNPGADAVKKYNRDLDIIMQKQYKCNCFTKNDMATVNKPVDPKTVAVHLGLDPETDAAEINAYVRKARDRSIQQLDTLYDDQIKMLATIRATLSDEVLNVLENSSGYEAVNKKKDPHSLYQFAIDIIYYKINTNAHVQTTSEIVLEVYNIKQGPTEDLINYQHRATSSMEMATRTQVRHTKFLVDVARTEENVIPANTIAMYCVLRGLNDNYNGFKMDVSNRMQHNKGDFPYTDVNHMLNHAAEFHSITSSKGKSMINFSSSKSPSIVEARCAHCKSRGHSSDTCWQKFPALRPKSTSTKKITTDISLPESA
jgi:hypothetical protein